jgi:hypothetical protein
MPYNAIARINPEAKDDWDAMAQWMDMRQTLFAQDIHWDEADSMFVADMHQMAIEKSGTWAGRAAMAVLNMYHGGNYYLYPEDDGGWQPRRMPQGQLLVSDARLQAYPNPANSFLNVVVSGTDVWHNASLTVYDAMGRVIERKTMPLRHAILDTRQWASGSYVVEVRANGFVPITTQVYVVH